MYTRQKSPMAAASRRLIFRARLGALLGFVLALCAASWLGRDPSPAEARRAMASAR